MFSEKVFFFFWFFCIFSLLPTFFLYCSGDDESDDDDNSDINDHSGDGERCLSLFLLLWYVISNCEFVGSNSPNCDLPKQSNYIMDQY